MNAAQTPPARLTLSGHEATPARLEIVARPARTRFLRALGALVVCWALIVPVALIPPHIPWALAAFLGGIYFAYKQWTGEYVVQRFEAHCPRCGNVLELKPGSKIGLLHTMTCFQCHHQPVLRAEV